MLVLIYQKIYKSIISTYSFFVSQNHLFFAMQVYSSSANSISCFAKTVACCRSWNIFCNVPIFSPYSKTRAMALIHLTTTNHSIAFFKEFGNAPGDGQAPGAKKGGLLRSWSVPRSIRRMMSIWMSMRSNYYIVIQLSCQNFIHCYLLYVTGI